MTKPDFKETNRRYAVAKGGLPPLTQDLAKDLLGQEARFTPAYAFIPHRVLADIVASTLPFWQGTRLWVLARPLSGFAETFSHYLMELAPQGGSDRPDDDADAEHVLFVVEGEITLSYNDQKTILTAGGYAYLPVGCQWTLHNTAQNPAHFHWIRKRYQAVEGIAPLNLSSPTTTPSRQRRSLPMVMAHGRRAILLIPPTSAMICMSISSILPRVRGFPLPKRT